MHLKIEGIGWVGRDPQTREVGERSVTSFSVATNPNGNRDRTVWLNISAWGRLGEICAEYVKKGSLVFIDGILSANDTGNPRAWLHEDEPRASFDVMANRVIFLNRVENEGGTTEADGIDDDFNLDEIPF